MWRVGDMTSPASPLTTSSTMVWRWMWRRSRFPWRLIRFWKPLIPSFLRRRHPIWDLFIPSFLFFPGSAGSPISWVSPNFSRFIGFLFRFDEEGLASEDANRLDILFCRLLFMTVFLLFFGSDLVLMFFFRRSFVRLFHVLYGARIRIGAWLCFHKTLRRSSRRR